MQTNNIYISITLSTQVYGNALQKEELLAVKNRTL